MRAGDPFAYSGEKRELHRLTHTDLLTAIREEQARIGRYMTDSEVDRFAREFHASAYRQDVRRIIAFGVGDEQNEE